MWLYFILNESGPRQATLGKSLLGLKVTDLDGNRLTVTTAAWRTVCKLAFFEIGHLSFCSLPRCLMNLIHLFGLVLSSSLH